MEAKVRPMTGFEVRDPSEMGSDELAIIASDSEGRAFDPEWFAAVDLEIARRGQPACESGWTGDRCTFPLFHDGDHSND